MFKKMLLATIAAGVLSTFAFQITPARAIGHWGGGTGFDELVGMTCKDAAKQVYPDDRKMRRNWRKLCKETWRLHRGR